MKIQTERPVIKMSPAKVEEYLNASGASRRAKRRAGKPKKKGQFVEKVKGFTKKVVDSGVLPIIAAQFGNEGAASLPPIDGGATGPSNNDLPADNSSDMSMGTKILIGVAVAGVIGGALYFYSKNNK